MNVELYKNYFNNLILCKELKIQIEYSELILNDTMFDISRIVINRETNIITMLDLDMINTKTHYDGGNNANVIGIILDAGLPLHLAKAQYYIPFSVEDEFQKSTTTLGNVMPFELAPHIDALIDKVVLSASSFKRTLQ